MADPSSINPLFLGGAGSSASPLAVWLTVSNLGSYVQQNSVYIQLQAVTTVPNATITYSVAFGSTLPTGLALNPVTGIITGTMPAVTVDTPYSFIVDANNGNGDAYRTFTMLDTVDNEQGPIWVTGAGSIGSVAQMASFSATLLALDPNNLPVGYRLENAVSLPPGLALNVSTGIISGTAGAVSQDTTYTFTVDATNGFYSVPRTFNITVTYVPGIDWITPAGTLLTQLQGTEVFSTLLALSPTNAVVSYTFASNTALPNGMGLDSQSGVVAGVLPLNKNTTVDVYSFIANAYDGNVSGTRSFSLVSLTTNIPTPNTSLANYLSLVHFDGLDGSEYFTDSTGNNTQPIGQPVIDASQGKFGQSVYLDGSSCIYILPISTHNFDLSLTDFTVDFYAMFPAVPTTAMSFFQISNSNLTIGYDGNSNVVVTYTPFSNSNTAQATITTISSAWTPFPYVWSLISVQCSNLTVVNGVASHGLLTVYADGNAISNNAVISTANTTTTTNSVSNSASIPFSMAHGGNTVAAIFGGDSGGHFVANAWMDELLVSNVARHIDKHSNATNFIPDPKPVPDLPRWITVTLPDAVSNTNYLANLVVTDPIGKGVLFSVANGSTLPLNLLVGNTIVYPSSNATANVANVGTLSGHAHYVSNTTGYTFALQFTDGLNPPVTQKFSFNILDNNSPVIPVPVVQLLSLMHFDGTVGSSTFIDSTGNNTAPIGNAVIDNTFVHGNFSQSVYLDGSSCIHILPISTHSFDLSLTDWTIEFYVLFENIPIVETSFFQISNTNVTIGYDGNSNIVVNYQTLGSNSSNIISNIAWNQQTLPAQSTWQAIAYGNNTFVAIDITNIVATSPDGIAWTQQTLPTTTTWVSIAYGNSTFVAIDNTGIAATSPDGINWTQQTLPVQTFWQAITYGNAAFVIIDNTGVAATSPDGINWTQQTLPVQSTWQAITYGNGIFVAIDNTITAATSPDGVNWTQQSLPVQTTWVSIAYGNNTFVAIDNTGISATSPDGITWTQQTLPVNTTWQAITYGNEFLIIDTTNISATSPDGFTWTQVALPLTTTWVAVAYGNNTFVAIDNTGVAATLLTTQPTVQAGSTISSSWVPVANTWTNICVMCSNLVVSNGAASNGVLTVYLNGNSISNGATISTANTIIGTSNNISIPFSLTQGGSNTIAIVGADNVGNYFTGWMDELRVSNTAVYVDPNGNALNNYIPDPNPFPIVVSNSLGTFIERYPVSTQILATSSRNLPITYTTNAASIPGAPNVAMSNSGLIYGSAPVTTANSTTGTFSVTISTEGTSNVTGQYSITYVHDYPPYWTNVTVDIPIISNTSNTSNSMSNSANSISNTVVYQSFTVNTSTNAINMLYTGFETKNFPGASFSAIDPNGLGVAFYLLNSINNSINVTNTDTNYNNVINTSQTIFTLPFGATMQRTGNISVGSLPVVNTTTTFSFAVSAYDGFWFIPAKFGVTVKFANAPVWQNTISNVVISNVAIGNVYSNIVASPLANVSPGNTYTTYINAIDTNNPSFPITYSLNTTAFKGAVTTQNAITNVVTTYGSLPPGLSFNTTNGVGIISGLQTGVSNSTEFVFAIDANNSIKTTTQDFSIFVQVVHNIVWKTTSGRIAQLITGHPITGVTIEAIALDLTPVTYSTPIVNAITNATTLPNGISFIPIVNSKLADSAKFVGTAPVVAANSANTHQIVYTDFTFTIYAKTAYANVGRSFSISVGDTYLTWNTASALGTFWGAAVTPTIGISASTTPTAIAPITYSLANAINLANVNLVFHNTTATINTIVGNTFADVTTNTVGTFIANATDGINHIQRTFTVTVNPSYPPDWITPSGLLQNQGTDANAVTWASNVTNLGSYPAGTSLSETLTAITGTFGYTLNAVDPQGLGLSYSLTTGTLPPNITFNDGVFSGTMAGTDAATVSVTVTDGIKSNVRSFGLQAQSGIQPISFTIDGSIPGFTINTTTFGHVPSQVFLDGTFVLPAVGSFANTTYTFAVSAYNGVMTNTMTYTVTSLYPFPYFTVPNGTTIYTGLGDTLLPNAAVQGQSAVSVVAVSPVGRNFSYTILTPNAIPSSIVHPQNSENVFVGIMPPVTTAATYSFIMNASDGHFIIQNTFSIVAEVNPYLAWGTPAGSIGYTVPGTYSSTAIVANGATGNITYTLDTTQLPPNLQVANVVNKSGNIVSVTLPPGQPVTIYANGLNIVPVKVTAHGPNTYNAIWGGVIQPVSTETAFPIRVTAKTDAGFSITRDFTLDVLYDEIILNNNEFIDPYANSVVMLLHFIGANGSRTFTDEMGHTIGRTQVIGLLHEPGIYISTNCARNGFSSAYFDGNSGLLTGNPNFDLSADDWTIECSIYFTRFTSKKTAGCLFSSNSFYITFLNNVLTIYYSYTPSIHEVPITYTQKFSTDFTLNAWHTLAIVRDTGTSSIRVYFDGILAGAAVGTIPPAFQKPVYDSYVVGHTVYYNYWNYAFCIGCRQTQGEPGLWMTGQSFYMDNFRLTTAVRYSANTTQYVVSKYQFPTPPRWAKYTPAGETQSVVNLGTFVGGYPEFVYLPTIAPYYANTPSAVINNLIGTVNVINESNTTITNTWPYNLTVISTVNNGQLPPPMNLLANGLIEGTTSNPTTDTTYTFGIQVTDQLNPVVREFSLTIKNNKPPVWVTPSGLIANSVSGYFLSTSVAAHDPEGFPVTYSFISGSLPTNQYGANVTVNATTGVISGPTTAQNTVQFYFFTVAASDGVNSVNRDFSIELQGNSPPIWVTPAVANSSLPIVLTGKNYKTNVVATATTSSIQAPIVYSEVGSLPKGITMTSNGVISGYTVASHSQNYPITLYADNGFGNTALPVVLQVSTTLPPYFTNNSATFYGYGGTNANAVITAHDPTGLPLTFVMLNTTLPNTTIGSSNGVISTLPVLPNPIGGATYPMTVYVTDQAASCTATFYYAIAHTNPPVWNQSTNLGSFSGAVSIPLNATDPQGLNVIYSMVSSSNAIDLIYNTSNAVLYGTLVNNTGGQSQPITVTLKATNGIASNTQTFTLISLYNGPPFWLPPLSVPAGFYGKEYNGFVDYEFSSTYFAPNVIGPYSAVQFSLASGSLPAGLHIVANAAVSYFGFGGGFGGTPTEPVSNYGPFTFVLGATNSAGTGYGTFVMHYGGVPSWITGNGTNLANWFPSNPVTQNIQSVTVRANPSTGQTIGYQMDQGTSLPNSLSLDQTTGVISGPVGFYSTAATVFTFVIGAYNAGIPAAIVDETFTITIKAISPPHMTVWDSGNTTLKIGQSFSFTYTAVDPQGYPITYSLASGAFPDNLALTDNGDGTATLQGTVQTDASTGTYNYSVLVSNPWIGATFVSPNYFPNIIVTSPIPVWVTANNSIIASWFPSNPVTQNVQSVTITANPTSGDSIYYQQISGTIPNSLTLDQNTGVISGPVAFYSTAATAFTFVVGAFDNVPGSGVLNSSQVNRTFIIDIKAITAPHITVGDSATVSLQLGQSFSFTFTAVDPQSYPITYSIVSGSLPDGINLVDNGDGTATMSGSVQNTASIGTYPYTVAVSNNWLSATYISPTQFPSFIISSPHPTWNTANNSTLANWYPSNPVTQNVQSVSVSATASAGQTISYQLMNGSLPSGVNLDQNNGMISGVVGFYSTTAVTPFTFVIGAFDAGLSVSEVDHTFIINVLAVAAPSITSGHPGTYTIAPGNSLPGTFTFTAVDPQSYPISFSIASGSMPPGVNFTDNGNGTATINGTVPNSPSSSGTYPYTVTVNNAWNSRNYIAPSQFPLLIVGIVAPTWGTTWQSRSIYPSNPLTQNVQSLPALTTYVTNPSGYAIRFSFDSSLPLPPNMTMDATTGVISGVVSVASTTSDSAFSVLAQVYNVDGSGNSYGDIATTVLYITVRAPDTPTFTYSNVASNYYSTSPVGIVVTLHDTIYGQPGSTLSASLISGLTFTDNLNGTGLIGGAVDPSVATGTYAIAISGTNVAGGTGSSSVSINVTQVTVPVWNTSSNPLDVSSYFNPTASAGSSRNAWVGMGTNLGSGNVEVNAGNISPLALPAFVTNLETSGLSSMSLTSGTLPSGVSLIGLTSYTTIVTSFSENGWYLGGTLNAPACIAAGTYTFTITATTQTVTASQAFIATFQDISWSQSSFDLGAAVTGNSGSRITVNNFWANYFNNPQGWIGWIEEYTAGNTFNGGSHNTNVLTPTAGWQLTSTSTGSWNLPSTNAPGSYSVAFAYYYGNPAGSSASPNLINMTFSIADTDWSTTQIDLNTVQYSDLGVFGVTSNYIIIQNITSYLSNPSNVSGNIGIKSQTGVGATYATANGGELYISDTASGASTVTIGFQYSNGQWSPNTLLITFTAFVAPPVWNNGGGDLTGDLTIGVSSAVFNTHTQGGGSGGGLGITVWSSANTGLLGAPTPTTPSISITAGGLPPGLALNNIAGGGSLRTWVITGTIPSSAYGTTYSFTLSASYTGSASVNATFTFTL